MKDPAVAIVFYIAAFRCLASARPGDDSLSALRKTRDRRCW
ncbi:MAG TPA: hypothetical protein VN933_13945 [Candidatus Eremiobacteraceae bacterium]|jgi:hypothetical protein|nr:hypothetical protein [Candidatus Eremiobacteraceae bacterium]